MNVANNSHFRKRRSPRCNVCDLGLLSVLASHQVSQQKEELCSCQLVHDKALPMSLLEDVLDVLRIVLEYFGVPPDMLVPVWDSQQCGQYRSIVRMIGTNLPLTPTPRIHFQIPLLACRPHGYVDIAVDTPAIPSFADVLWVIEDEGDSFAKTRNHLPPTKQSTVNRDVPRYSGPALRQAQGGSRSVRQTATLKKITALESELLKLRAQIAMIVTVAPASGLTEIAPGTPMMSPAPPPTLTSTPRCTAPPPPPPPPPPPCPSSIANTSSVLESIQQHKRNSKEGQLKPQGSGSGGGSEVKGIPSMLDVLKDLNQVKLRSVERSPGGTPVGRRRSKGSAALLNDPAALIAEALKRKFAQHRHNNSDKENSLELSPFGSPETPKIPHHTRRSQGRIHL